MLVSPTPGAAAYAAAKIKKSTYSVSVSLSSLEKQIGKVVSDPLARARCAPWGGRRASWRLSRRQAAAAPAVLLQRDHAARSRRMPVLSRAWPRSRTWWRPLCWWATPRRAPCAGTWAPSSCSPQGRQPP
jgi:hypothetical protein